MQVDIRDMDSVLGLGRSPGEGHGNQLQYSCLENSHGLRSLVGKVYRVAKSQTQLKWLSKHTQRERGFPCAPVIKNSPTNAGDVGSIPGGEDSLEKARLGWFERIALKHIYYHMWNRWPIQVQCMKHGTQIWCTGTTPRDGMGREVAEGFRMGATCTNMADSC